MNNVRCLIVDDESIARRIIEGYLTDLVGFEIIACCKNAMEAIEVLDNYQIDLMFLDIEMPKLKGLDLLKTLSSPPSVILTTAHRNYALESYDYEILDYLLKPISFDRFVKSINRYKKLNKTVNKSSQKMENSNVIYVKSERKTVKIKTSEISHIEGMNNYLIIHTQDKRHIVYKSFTKILSELGDSFIRIHKSYLINSTKIESFTKEEVSIHGKVLPIGKTYKDVIANF